MEITPVNPWKWQQSFGYSQAISVEHNEGTLYCAGQTAVNSDGQPVDGTMEEQIKLTLSNLQQLITNACYATKHIVRLNIYTTSIEETFAVWPTIANWLHQHGSAPASTMVEVKALALPQLKIEIEATLVK